MIVFSSLEFKCLIANMENKTIKKAEAEFDIKIDSNPFLSDAGVDVFGKLGLDLMHTMYERYYLQYWNLIKSLLNGSGRLYAYRSYCSHM